ncbi:hypothetical protein DYB32_002820 [Aphanomyces invadans]|uniref:Kinesin-like protein n=1 Tax=Aphanomyces invadans TaxID=157072 RepID=A0A418B2C6_9STRA|nr:hypothetical protein DYB32_002820 [Aphanomyces invadans]
MASPGKRQREVLEGLADVDGTKEGEDGAEYAPPAKSLNLGIKDGPRLGQAAPTSRLNRFGFGLVPPKPIIIAAATTTKRESNQDENDGKNANVVIVETKPPTTIPPASNKPSVAEVAAAAAIAISDLPRPSEDNASGHSSGLDLDMSPKDSFVALIKDRMSVVSQIEDAVKLKRSRLKPHDWRGKFEEQRATLQDLRGLLRRQDAFKLDQTIAMDRKVLQREVDHARERSQQVDAVTHEIQSNVTDMQVTIRMLKSEKDRLTAELGEAKSQLQGSSDLQTQLVEAQAARDLIKIELDQQVATLSTENQSLRARLDAALEDHASAKASLTRKDDEVSTMFASLKEMQDFATSANVKLEADNTQLRAKLVELDAQVKDLDTKYTAASTAASVPYSTVWWKLMDSCNSTMQACRTAKDEALVLVAEKSEQVRAVTNEVHEHIRQASIEKELRVLIDSQMRELRVEQLATNAQMEAVKAEMKHMVDRHADEMVAAKAALEALEARMHSNAVMHTAEVEKLREAKVSAESELNTWRSKHADNEMVEMKALVEAKREAEVLKLRLKELNLHGSQTLHEKDTMIATLEAKVKEGEAQRRRMHNTIQELRGNVRVFARTRPFLPSDGDATQSALACDGDLQRVTLKREKEAHAFTFDRVFAPAVGQDAVFEEVSEFVQSAIDGYQVCLFSGNGHMRGIIPRSIEKIIAEATKSADQGWRYDMHASFLEIYNETVRDLLADKADVDKKLVLKMDPKSSNGVTVQDLTLVPIHSLHQVEGIMEKAARVRSVACTDMNAQSSRSHSVFSLHLREGVNDSQGTVLEGKLNLVDLAGSERLSRSGATGSRLKETQAINKSLSCLTDVFAAIGNKSPHVNLSPTVESAHESLCSLRFAQHVNQCELGKPKRQLKKKSDDDGVVEAKA